MTTWGVVATIKAPETDILRFAAHHLELGAQRLHLFLDDPQSSAVELLNAHPAINATICDNDWWRSQRPAKHQVRQTRNATRAYGTAQVDWLIHMDVDEFLVPDRPIADILRDLPADQPVARIRPMEQLAGNGNHFKGFIPNGPDRNRIVRTIYPTYGRYIKGGFLSHLAGKVFVRTGLPDMQIRIHNAFRHDAELKGPDDTDGIDLAHCHATSWEDWLTRYRFRLARGSYRAALAPNRPRDKGGITLHELFKTIEADDGEAGLRAFFDEVCADTPQLRERLARHGLLRHADLDLIATTAKHFPHAGA